MFATKVVAPIISVLSVLAFSPLLAQPKHPVIWAESPVLAPVQDSFRNAPAVFILNEVVSQTQKSDDGDYVQYYTMHWKIHLNDELGTEAFNTFHIPVGLGASLYEIMARSIQPGGKVVQVARDKIRKIKSEGGGYEYLVAMEGVSPGAEVEMLYTLRLSGTASGSECFQYRIPIQTAVFRLIEPEPMVYDCKGYNGFPNPIDSSLGDQRCYSAIAYDIPALDEEPNSRYQDALRRVDYKLSYVLRTIDEKDRRQSWDDMAQALWQRYVNLSDRDIQKAKKFMKKSGLELSGNEEQRVIVIEDFLKKNFILAAAAEDEDLETAIRNRQISERGLVRLFAACFQAEGITYEIGKVNNRFDLGVDDSLEIWSRFSEYCFYLPGTKSYLAPAATFYRYPFLPYPICGAQAVFAKQGNSGSDIFAAHRLTPQTRASQNSISILSNVRFEGEALEPLVQASWSFKGQSASDLLPQFLAMTQDKEKDFVQSLIGLGGKPDDLERFDIKNISLKNFSDDSALIISATMRAADLMEKAGPKYLFQIGALIGEQVTLYSEKPRHLPVVLDFPNEQVRTLRIIIPSGYRIANPDQLRSNKTCMSGSRELCSFHSDYKMEGKVLDVQIQESYRQTDIPLSQYAAYCDVVNAAAAFSKRSIVLEKI
ncbi:MAG: DUF3857 domain-containing protein [Bacteroidetes bacterium]|nr:DUF3857 domain-containing protein [Bacteroidota bacterium]